MISNPKIISKPNNVETGPSSKWSIDTNIYVKGRINLGLDNEIVFDANNSPTLNKVIRINNALIGQEKNFESTLKGLRKSITIKTIA